jgi:Ni/Co efflux regulator RcnB
MKLSAVPVAFALLATPVLAQSTDTATTTTKTTHVQATTHNTAHHATKRSHHTMRCGCPSHYKVHRHTVVKKTTVTK